MPFSFFSRVLAISNHSEFLWQFEEWCYIHFQQNEPLVSAHCIGIQLEISSMRLLGWCSLLCMTTFATRPPVSSAFRSCSGDFATLQTFITPYKTARVVRAKANLRLCVFADIVYVQKEHKWTQHRPLGQKWLWMGTRGFFSWVQRDALVSALGWLIFGLSLWYPG